jgi:hypothetical protein
MLLRLCNTKQLRAAGVGPISRQRPIPVMGGLRELTAVTVKNGGRIRNIRSEALGAVTALLGPSFRPEHKLAFAASEAASGDNPRYRSFSA